jgi:hypothetical protein
MDERTRDRLGDNGVQASARESPASASRERHRPAYGSGLATRGEADRQITPRKPPTVRQDPVDLTDHVPLCDTAYRANQYPNSP